MGKLEKSVTPLNLQKYRVFAVDTDPLSKAFSISQLGDVLTIGKNAFLINGSPYLEPTTNVLVELVDSNGNTVFSQPVKGYTEGLAKVVSIEIYDDTPSGLATLTILGELRIGLDGTSIPPEWANVYNVKWQKSILINPGESNSSLIRIFETPSIEISEVFNSARTITGSAMIYNSNAIINGFPSTYNSNSLSLQYAVNLSDAPLYRDMISGTFGAIINNDIFTSSISDILNSSVLILDTPYSIDGQISSFTANSYSISFFSSPTYSLSPVKDSFAQITLSNLTTFSGDLRRVKIFIKGADTGDAEYKQVWDTVLGPTNLLMTQSNGSITFDYGYISDQSVIDTFWSGQFINGARPPCLLGLFADGTYLDDGTLFAVGDFCQQ